MFGRPVPGYISPDYSNNFSLARGWDTYSLGLCLIQLSRGISEDEAKLEAASSSIGSMPNMSESIRILLEVRIILLKTSVWIISWIFFSGLSTAENCNFPESANVFCAQRMVSQDPQERPDLVNIARNLDNGFCETDPSEW